MKEIIKNEGLVIKVTDYNDAAVIAQVLTKDGFKALLIKGAKKLSTTTHPLASPLTYISYTSTNMEGVSLLTEGVVLDNNSILKEDLSKYQASLAIIEKVSFFYEGVKDYPLLFDFTLKVLELIKTKSFYYSIVSLFEVKLLYLLGVNPNFKICAKCSSIINTGFLSMKLGGVICANCLNYLDEALTENETECLKELYYTKLEKMTDELYTKTNLISLSEGLDKYYGYHLDFYSKAKPVFYKILNMLGE